MTHPYDPAMAEAIASAAEGRWRTAPNPAVGAVLVRDGAVVARGAHRCCGQAHAEIECLADAAVKGIDPAQCILVVTLEPCTHHGQTPPCTDAILAAGVRHVVVGLLDPNEQAAGGVERLRAAGVTVETGILEDACRELVTDFLVWQKAKRPYVLLKLASTVDGRIASRSGHSKWISSEASRAKVHALRAAIGICGGAVLVGGNTLLADNPLLTARPEGIEAPIRQPLAAGVTSRLASVMTTLRVVQQRPTETVLFTTAAAAASPTAAGLRENGVRVRGIDPWRPRSGLDLNAVMADLFALGCPYVLCEGGGKLGLALLEAGLVDEFHLHLAPKVLGDAAAVPLFGGREPLNMDEAIDMRMIQAEMCGGDCHLLLRPTPRTYRVGGQ